MRRSSFLTLFLAACAAAPVAYGQTPSDGDTLAALKARTSFTDEDRQKLNAWTEKQVTALVDGAAGAAATLRTTEGGTDAFREAYGVALSAAVASRYKEAAEGPAAQLLAVLSAADTIDAHRIFIEGLRDERISVRAAAAIGLRTLQRRISAAGGAYFTDAMEGLRAAMKKEASPVALRLMYGAMDYRNSGATPADPKLTVSVLLDVLESRVDAYQKETGRAFAADGPGLALATSLAGQMGDGEKSRLAKAAAGILRGAVSAYTTEYFQLDARRDSELLVRTRNALEALIAEAEKALVAALGLGSKPHPKLVAAMETGDKIKTYHAMNEWADLLKEAGLGDFGIATTDVEGG